MNSHFEFWEAIERVGGRIVLDATLSGELGLRPLFDERLTRQEPFSALTDAYFDHVHDIFRRPNDRFHEWLGERLTARCVQGIIFRHYVWCDLWHAEAQRLKDWSALPLLVLEAGDAPALDAHDVSRLQAFLEMLSPPGQKSA